MGSHQEIRDKTIEVGNCIKYKVRVLSYLFFFFYIRMDDHLYVNYSGQKQLGLNGEIINMYQIAINENYIETF